MISKYYVGKAGEPANTPLRGACTFAATDEYSYRITGAATPSDVRVILRLLEKKQHISMRIVSPNGIATFEGDVIVELDK